MTPEQKKKVRRIARLIAELDREGINAETYEMRDVSFYQTGYGFVARIDHNDQDGWSTTFAPEEDDTDE